MKGPFFIRGNNGNIFHAIQKCIGVPAPAASDKFDDDVDEKTIADANYASSSRNAKPVATNQHYSFPTQRDTCTRRNAMKIDQSVQ